MTRLSQEHGRQKRFPQELPLPPDSTQLRRFREQVRVERDEEKADLKNTP